MKKQIDFIGSWEFTFDRNGPNLSKIPNGSLTPEHWMKARVPGTVHTDLLLVAGEYDVRTHLPRFKVRINVPSHVKEQVTCEEMLLGDETNCTKAFDIHNKSSWPAFVELVATLE